MYSTELVQGAIKTAAALILVDPHFKHPERVCKLGEFIAAGSLYLIDPGPAVHAALADLASHPDVVAANYGSTLL